MTTAPEEEAGIVVGIDQDSRTVRVRLRLLTDEALVLLGRGGARPDPWYAEFAHVLASRARISWRDDGREEDVPHQDHEEPSFAIGDRVVFRDSDPVSRREWTFAEFDRPPGWPAWSTPLETCTIRRGSTVKRGVSIDRLELVPSE